MPLSEFLSLFKVNLDPNQQKPSSTDDPSSRDGEPMVEIDYSSENCGDHRVLCEQTRKSKRKSRELVVSECRSDDIGNELVGVMKKSNTGRGGTGSKRSRVAEVHNLSERRRRDRINEKMRALQQLIPNCNKGDKASMLDEAIEYMKSLQLQVQIMSIGGGSCIPPMMYQHIHPSHFPPVGVGCPCFHVPPFQGAHFPSPLSGQITGLNPQVYGNHTQGPKSSVPITPLVLRTRITSAMGLSTTNKSSKLIPDQVLATNKMFDQSSIVQESNQATDDKRSM